MFIKTKMRLTLTLLVLGLSCRLCKGKKENDTVVQNHIKALRKELFKDRGYDVMSRPVLNYSHPTDVHIWLDLNYIVDLDLRTGILTSEGWLRLWWVDEQLRWRPDEFGGIADIRVTAGEVFRPDIVLLNSVQPENIIRTSTHSDLLLYESGHLVWVPALSMRTVCAELDLSEWPTDRQSCEYHFASWTYEGSALNLVNASETISLDNLAESSEWTVLSTSCEKKVHSFEGAQYPEVIFRLNMQRKGSLYRATVYFPVLCALAFSLMTFFLRFDNKLRLHLGGLSFGTLLIELLFLGNRLGFGSLGTPRVVIYIGQMIILVAFSLLWSSAAYTLSTMDTLVSPRVINIVQPMQRWLFLVTKPGGAGGDKEQLVVNGSGGGGDNLEEGPTRADISMTRELPEIAAAAVVVGVTPNQLLVQVLDRLLFALQLLLIIFLHN